MKFLNKLKILVLSFVLILSGCSGSGGFSYSVHSFNESQHFKKTKIKEDLKILSDIKFRYTQPYSYDFGIEASPYLFKINIEANHFHKFFCNSSHYKQTDLSIKRDINNAISSLHGFKMNVNRASYYSEEEKRLLRKFVDYCLSHYRIYLNNYSKIDISLQSVFPDIHKNISPHYNANNQSCDHIFHYDHSIVF